MSLIYRIICAGLRLSANKKGLLSKTLSGWKMGLEPLKMFSVYQLVTERTKSLYHTLALCEKRWFAYLFEAFQYLQR